jgi:Icc-related predicted phosphoesterase
MKLALISDTHDRHRRVTIPPCDVLVHAGDLSWKGELSILEDVSNWFGELKTAGTVKEIVVIGGNHDLTLQDSDRHRGIARALLRQNAHYLQDSSVVIDGIKFYGSPYTPEFYDWAFMLPRNSPAIGAKWAEIPDDVQVLITHGPPHGTGDEVPPRPRTAFDIDADWEHAGCAKLADRVKQLRHLKLHVFGHIHLGHGQYQQPGHLAVNASTCNDAYQPEHDPIVVTL